MRALLNPKAGLAPDPFSTHDQGQCCLLTGEESPDLVLGLCCVLLFQYVMDDTATHLSALSVLDANGLLTKVQCTNRCWAEVT